MANTKKIKLYIGLFYLIFVSLFLYFFFSKFSFQEITSYEFIKNNRNYFIELRQSNLFFLASIFVLFTIVWVLAAGFGSPVAIFAGFIFGPVIVGYMAEYFGLTFNMYVLSVIWAINGLLLLYLMSKNKRKLI